MKRRAKLKPSQCARLALILIGTLITVSPGQATHAQTVVQIPGITGRVTGIEEANGQVWVATTDGLYRVTGDHVIKIGSWNEEVITLEETAGQLWVRTNDRLFRVDVNTITPISGLFGIIKLVQAAAGRAWIGTSNGLFYLEGNEAKVFAGVQGPVGIVREIAGQVWIGCSIDGLFRINGNVAVPVAGIKKFVDPSADKGLTAIVSEPVLERIGGRIWFGGYYQHTYVVEHNEARIISGVQGFAQAIEEVNKQIWIRTNKGIFAVGKGSTVAQSVFDYRVYAVRGATSVRETSDEVWIATYDGAYRLDKKRNEVQPVPGAREVVLTIEETDDQVWIGTDKGVYRVRKGERTAERIFGVPWGGRFKTVVGQIWIAGPALYHADQNTTAAQSILGVTAPNFLSVGGRLWMATPSGAFRLDEDVSINVTLSSSGSAEKSLLAGLLPGECLAEGTVRVEPQYEQGVAKSDPYGDSFSKQFFVIVTSDKNAFDEALQRDAYSPAKYFERSFPSGKRTVYISVRDRWGNTFVLPPRVVWVIPGVVSSLFFFLLLWLLVSVALLFLAPYFSFCHDLIVNPWFRKLGSAGLIPLILSVFPFARRHLLRRYLSEIRRDHEFAEWKERYVYPAETFLPNEFGHKLDHQRKLLLIGQSGLGKTSYFKHLAARYAAKDKRQLIPSKVVPVFIPLSSYSGGAPEELFYDQVSNFGRMHDRKLNEWFLKQGGFLIFLDGLNEVLDEPRKQLARFVNRHWKANFFCLSSQHSYPEFSGIREIKLESLGTSKVNYLLRRRLSAQDAESTIRQLTDETYALYAIPRDLEFAIELLQRGDVKVLPKSRSELYSAALSPVMDEWARNGQRDYVDQLFRRAYEMLCKREPFFDSEVTPLPDEIVIRLYDQRFLVKRSNHFFFRHDLVRDFLAAQHFFPRWKPLLATDGTSVDENWVEMLKFAFSALAVQGSADNQALMETLLTRSANKRFVGVLFNWLKATFPRECESWDQEFKELFGEAMLDDFTD